MRRRYLFFEQAKVEAERQVGTLIEQEKLLSDEELAALQEEKLKVLTELVRSRQKISPPPTLEEMEKKERQFRLLHEKAVELAKELSLDLDVVFEKGIGRLVFSAEDILFTASEKQHTYGLFSEIMEAASMVWFLVDVDDPSRVHLLLEYE